MIVWSAVVVPPVIKSDIFSVVNEFRSRVGHRPSRVEGKDGRKFNVWTEVVFPHNGQAVRDIIVGWVPVSIIDRFFRVGADHFSLTFGPGITDPSGDRSRSFLNVSLNSIGPSNAINEVSFQVIIEDEAGAILVIDDVVQIFIKAFNGCFNRVVQEVCASGTTGWRNVGTGNPH